MNLAQEIAVFVFVGAFLFDLLNLADRSRPDLLFCHVGDWLDRLSKERTQRIIDRAERRAVWTEVEEADRLAVVEPVDVQAVHEHRPLASICDGCGMLLPGGMTVNEVRESIGLPRLPAPRPRPLPLAMPLPGPPARIRV